MQGRMQWNYDAMCANGDLAVATDSCCCKFVSFLFQLFLSCHIDNIHISNPYVRIYYFQTGQPLMDLMHKAFASTQEKRQLSKHPNLVVQQLQGDGCVHLLINLWGKMVKRATVSTMNHSTGHRQLAE